MDPIEFCKLKHGTCACEKNGKANCAQVVRQAADPVEIRVANMENDAARAKRQAKYIQDEWPPMMAVTSHQSELIEALHKHSDRLLGEMMLSPHRSGKLTATEILKDYCKHDAILDWEGVKSELTEVDFSHLEGRYVKDPILPVRERRLGSSDKPHVKFMKDPVKVRPI